jgi:YVTN family beta-propeller protein
MSGSSVEAIVNDYFERVERALAPLPRSRRDQLLDELREHVATARPDLAEDSEVSVREVLERLGDPEDIAAEALGDDSRPQGGQGRLSRLLTRRMVITSTVIVVVLALAATLVVALSGSSTPVRAEAVASTVNVGGFPTGIAVDTVTGTVYVASGNGNELSMVNGTTCNASTTSACSKTSSVSTGGQDPIGVVVDEQTRTVYAVNGGSNTVSVINASTCNARDSTGCAKNPAIVDVPGGPEFLALNASTNTIYVADTDSGAVSVIDGNICNAESTQGCARAPASVAVGAGAFPIGVDEKTNSIYVGTNSGVAVINGRPAMPQTRVAAQMLQR